jgi:hypothetical protein
MGGLGRSYEGGWTKKLNGIGANAYGESILKIKDKIQ